MCRFCDWGEARFEAAAAEDPEAVARADEQRRQSQALWAQLMADIDSAAAPAPTKPA